MTRRDVVIVLGTLAVAVGLSAILFVGAAATSPDAAPEQAARPRVFFDQRAALPPGRTVGRRAAPRRRSAAGDRAATARDLGHRA